MKVVLKVKESFNLENLKHYGFRKQDYLMEYGRKKETGCNVWRLDDTRQENDYCADYVYYYGLTIFEETPKSGYYAPEYKGDDCGAEPRVVYMMDDGCSWMESTKFEFNPKLYDLIVDGVIEKVVCNEGESD